jgi:hypothetical protein
VGKRVHDAVRVQKVVPEVEADYYYGRLESQRGPAQQLVILCRPVTAECGIVYLTTRELGELRWPGAASRETDTIGLGVTDSDHVYAIRNLTIAESPLIVP